jgi:hypothetical protein
VGEVSRRSDPTHTKSQASFIFGPPDIEGVSNFQLGPWAYRDILNASNKYVILLELTTNVPEVAILLSCSIT